VPVAEPKRADPHEARLARLEARIEAERERLGVPGLALVVVQGGDVVLARGFGERTKGEAKKVDADTLFAIGSTTKAFTAMLVMMAVEAGKLALDDHPRTCLPDFRLRDAKYDAQLRIRDLLTHTSGLMGTDIGWYTGQLSRAELLQLVGEAEPVAAPRTAFHYQNVMYAAAGECAARAFGTDYETLLRSRIFAKIGMDGANLSTKATLASANHSTGHHRRGDGTAIGVPMRPLDAIAPAGGINASANMMGGWLKAMLARGKVGEQRLLGEKHFAELLAPQFPAGPGLDYTLGWIRARHRDHAISQHTGGIDGFSSLVAIMPDEDIGFALLTNVDHGDIHGFVTHEVFALVEPEDDKAPPAVPSSDEIGTYGSLGGFKVEVAREPGGIAMVVPGQPRYPLEHVEGRRYRLGPPAPPGFFATFRAKKGDAKARELWLEQPYGNLLLPLLSPDEIAAAARAEPPPEHRELLGTYKARADDLEVQLAAIDGRIALVVTGQPPAALEPAERDRFALVGLPPGFDVRIRRDARGKPIGLVLQRPDSALDLDRVGGSTTLDVEAVLRRRARAHGSARLGKHRSSIVESELSFVHQGLAGTATTWRAAPNRWEERTRIVAFGREIGRLEGGWDGTAAFERASFAPGRALEREQIELARMEAPFDPWAPDARPGTPSIVGESKIGDTRVVVVRFATDWGATITDSIDARRFLLVRRELEVPAGTSGATLRETRTYSDYRKVAGVLVPHRVETESTNGKVVAIVERVVFDAPLPADAFTRTSSERSAAPAQ
jgi:CubicO group peptidase (beta-lactamase class C family)